MSKDYEILMLLNENQLETNIETGEIFSMRTNNRRGEKVKINGVNCKGYIRHGIYSNGVDYHVFAHRLIWMSVNGLIPDDLEIDHINMIRNDNRLINLRLVSRSINLSNRSVPFKTKVGKISNEVVNEIIQKYLTGLTTIRGLAKMYGLSKTTIHNMVTGKRSLVSMAT